MIYYTKQKNTDCVDSLVLHGFGIVRFGWDFLSLTSNNNLHFK